MRKREKEGKERSIRKSKNRGKIKKNEKKEKEYNKETMKKNE